jgi:hypothetical protein
MKAIGYLWSPRYGHAKQPVFEKAAGRKLLAAIVETVVSGKPAKLAGTPARELDAATLIARLDPATAQWAAGTHSHAQKATLYIVIDTLEAGALPVVLDWLLERPSGMVRSNMHTMGAAAAAMIAAFPATKAAFERRVADVIAGADAEQAQRATSLQQAVAFEIR